MINYLRCHTVFLHLKPMFSVEGALAVLGLARDFTWGLSCPFHCSGSIIPTLCLGLVLGFILGLGFGLFIAWQVFRYFYLASPHPAAPSFQGSFNSRLRGYLHEHWPSFCSAGFDCCSSATHCCHSILDHCSAILWHTRLLWFWVRDPHHLRLPQDPWTGGGFCTFGLSYYRRRSSWTSRLLEREGWGEALLYLWWSFFPSSLGLSSWILGQACSGHQRCFWVRHNCLRVRDLALGGLEVCLQGSLSSGQFSRLQALRSWTQFWDCLPDLSNNLWGRDLLCRSQASGPATMASRKTRMKFAVSGGESSLMVWTPATELVKDVGPEACFLLPIMQRQGGILAAIPFGFLSEEVLIDAAEEGYEGVVGPSKDFEAPLLEEDENGQIVESGYAKSFVVVDLGDSCLAQIKDYDPVVDTAVFPFEETMPASLPRVVDVIQGVFDWIEATTLSRVHFYSAREEQTVPALPKRSTPKKVSNAALVEQLTNLAAQVQMIGEQQKLLSQAMSPAAARSSPDPVGVPLAGGALTSRLPNVSNGLDLMMSTPKKATALLGPPPKTKAVGTPLIRAAPLEEDEPKDIAEERTTAEGSILGALASQSTAITALVAHLAGGGDAMQDLSSSGSQHLALSSRGVGRREKMQAELANRSSNYFLAVQQQMYRRMNPAKVVPKTLEELGSSGVSMTGYLERYGGYKNARDAGLSLWVAAHAMDCAAEGDFVGTREYLALLCAALEPKCPRWVMVAGLGADSPGRSANNALRRSDATSGCTREALCSLGAPNVGGNIAGLSPGDRGPHYAEDGGEDFETSPIQSYNRGCRGGENPFTSKASQVSQEAKGCTPCKGAMKNGEFLCMDNGGGGLSSAGAVQVEVPVQPSPVGGATTFKHGTTIPPQKTRTDGQQLTYPKWCALLVSNVLKTRTSFASYLNKSIFLSQAKNRFGLAPTFFPIPLPPGDHFDRMPANLSQHRRRTFHLKRAVHTLCMALNFWYNGGSFADVELLQREPNDQHRCLYGRLAALIRSEGLTQPFPVAKSGRKFPNLIARLGELSDVLMKQGAIDPYTKSFAGGDFTLDEETSGCLSPYRDLDPSRLALHGCGNWDATSYLSDYLVMAYREPRVLLTGLESWCSSCCTRPSWEDWRIGSQVGRQQSPDGPRWAGTPRLLCQNLQLLQKCYNGSPNRRQKGTK